LSPVQVKVLPVAEAHEDYAKSVADTLSAAGIRVEIVEANDQLGKRIRTAKMEKTPYVLVVGDDDVAANTVGVNARGQDVERGVAVVEFSRRVTEEISHSVI
jgi:threonyl-tRNA synthetase